LIDEVVDVQNFVLFDESQFTVQKPSFYLQFCASFELYFTKLLFLFQRNPLKPIKTNVEFQYFKLEPIEKKCHQNTKTPNSTKAKFLIMRFGGFW